MRKPQPVLEMQTERPSANQVSSSMSRETDSLLKRAPPMGRSSSGRTLQPERVDDVAQHLRLFLHGLCGSGCLFDHCRVLLCGLVHLGNGNVDLLDAATLLVGGGRDFADDVVD